MHLFIGNIEGNSAEINGDESHHFTKVLRGKVGQEIQITDGKGKMGKGIVSQINSKSVEIDLNEVIENHEKRPYKIHIAIAPTKSMERMEFFMEKATEIGINKISFLKTFHSERKNINLDRCRKILVSAVKQSLKVYVPQLNDLVKFNDFVKENHPENKLIAHCDEDFTRLNFKEFIQPQKDYLILIGPEGDFSKEEIELALQNGFTGISLGNQRLRTETAALNAIFAANWINN